MTLHSSNPFWYQDGSVKSHCFKLPLPDAIMDVEVVVGWLGAAAGTELEAGVGMELGAGVGMELEVGAAFGIAAAGMEVGAAELDTDSEVVGGVVVDLVERSKPVS
jgi:hypothetical protein